MPLTKVVLKPGINKDDTPLASEGGYVDSDRVRFWRGLPQSLGGWILRTIFTGIARGAHEWVDLVGSPLMAWGTADKLYALRGGAVLDITPALSEGVLTQPFSTTINSAYIVVQHPGHGFAGGEIATFSNAIAVGGLVLNGTLPTIVIDKNSYSLIAGANATATATSAATDTVDYRVTLPAGSVSYVSQGGYGSGSYGGGPYGGLPASNRDLRVWSLDNFGQNLLASPSGGGLYEWHPESTTTELVTNGAFGTDTYWTKGAGWAIASGEAVKTAGTASQLTGPVPEGFVPGQVYRVTFRVARTAGSVKFQIGTGATFVDVGDASKSIRQAGTYTRQFRAPAGATSFAFSADAAFAGAIDDVSVKLETAAYRIKEAPDRIGYMFVDPNRLVVLGATREFDGDYNPLLTRWSDQENLTQWTPSATNLSGELPLASGSRVLSAIATRQQNLVWTDSALFALTFTPDAVFSQRLLGTSCGIIGPNAAVEVNGLAFWWSPNGFFGFQGSAPQRLDCSLERDVFDNLATLQAHKIYAGLNPAYNEIWWLYPDKRDGAGIECSRAVIFNFKEQVWSTSTMARSSWLAGDIFDNPIGFSTDGMIYDHEVGPGDANGMPLMAYLDTAFFDVEDGDHLMDIMRIVPDFERQAGPVTFTIQGRPFPNGLEWTVGPYVAQTTTQKLDMRRTARQLKLRIETNTAPSFWRWGVPKIDARKSGALR